MAPKANFLSLPGELRNRIYELYASAHQPTSILVFDSDVGPVAPPLARVCRQIRQELTSLELDRKSDLGKAVKLVAVVKDCEFAYLDALLCDPDPSHLQAVVDKARCLPRTFPETSTKLHIEFLFTQAWMQTDFETKTSLRGRQHWSGLIFRVLTSAREPGKVSVAFDPPGLEFDANDLSRLLGLSADVSLLKSWESTIESETVMAAVRDALLRQDAFFRSQRKVQDSQAQAEELAEMNAARPAGKRKMEYPAGGVYGERRLRPKLRR